MINALRFTDELEKAGFTPEQAKKSVDTWMTLMNDNFATKSDFRELQMATAAEFRELRLEFKSDLREVETKLDQMSSKIVIQLGSLMVIMMTIFVSILSK